MNLTVGQSWRIMCGMNTFAERHAAEIVRIAEIETVAGRPVHPSVTAIASAIVDPTATAPQLRALADGLADKIPGIRDARSKALAFLAVHACHAERFQRTGKSSYADDSARQADSSIKQHAAQVEGHAKFEASQK